MDLNAMRHHFLALGVILQLWHHVLKSQVQVLGYFSHKKEEEEKKHHVGTESLDHLRGVAHDHLRSCAVLFNLTWWLQRIAYNLRKLNQLFFYRTHEELILKFLSYIRWLVTFVFCESCEITVVSMNDIRVCFVCQAWNIVNNICLYFQNGNFCWHFS